jgi:alpha-tubulin suppressor-like RCC1 family protein
VPRPCSFQGLGLVKKVSCGDSHTAILTFEGLLYTCGSNQGGKLGLKDSSMNEMKSPTLVDLLQCHDVCCANSFTLAVTTQG